MFLEHGIPLRPAALQSCKSIQCWNDHLMKTSHRTRPLRVALVAPSIGILGGQAVQADRLLRAWQDDPDVEAWLVPINPVPPGALAQCGRDQVPPHRRDPAVLLAVASAGAPACRRRPRVLGVLLLVSPRAPSGGADRQAAGQARGDELPERAGPRSPEAFGDRARHAAVGRAECRAFSIPSGRVRGVRHSAPKSSRTSSTSIGSGSERGLPLRPNVLSTRNFEPLYNVACTLRAFRLVQDRYPDATLTLVGAGSEDAAPARAGRASSGSNTCGSPGAWRPKTSGATTPTPTSICRRQTSTTCRHRCSRRSPAAAPSFRPNAGGVPGDSHRRCRTACWSNAAITRRPPSGMLRLLGESCAGRAADGGRARELRRIPVDVGALAVAGPVRKHGPRRAAACSEPSASAV